MSNYYEFNGVRIHDQEFVLYLDKIIELIDKGKNIELKTIKGQLSKEQIINYLIENGALDLSYFENPNEPSELEIKNNLYSILFELMNNKTKFYKNKYKNGLLYLITIGIEIVQGWDNSIKDLDEYLTSIHS